MHEFQHLSSSSSETAEFRWGVVGSIAYDSTSRSLLTLHPDALLTFDPMRIDRFPVSGVLPNVLLGAGSADGERLVAINQDSLQVIDADGLHERLRIAHDGVNTRAVALSAVGDLLAILSASGELSLRSPLDGSVIARGQALAEFASASPRCAIGNDGSIAVTNGRGDVVLFTRSGSTLTESARTSLSGGAVTAMVAVPARKEFLVGMKDGSAHVVDEASLAVRVTLPTNGHAIGAMTPSFDGLRYFTAADDGSIRIWHAETGKELLTLNEERITAAPTAIFIEPNNERLVVGYANGAERIWDAVTWAERVRRRGKPEWPNTEPKLVPAESHPATNHER
jgi:WD40 repeat protein